MSGTEWERLKPQMLAQLIDIHQHEAMHEEAIETLDAQGYLDYMTVEKVVDVVFEEFPDWAIEHCKQQAEPNMDRGKSKYYHHSARWVEKAGKAYLAANRAQEWHEYLEGLIKKHTRKYALRQQLEALRKLTYTHAV